MDVPHSNDVLLYVPVCGVRAGGNAMKGERIAVGEERGEAWVGGWGMRGRYVEQYLRVWRSRRKLALTIAIAARDWR